MPATEAQKRAMAKYQKLRTKQLCVKFTQPDYELWEWAKAQENTGAYVRSLIRADMEKRKSE